MAFWKALFPESHFEPTGMLALFALRVLSKKITSRAAEWLADFGLTPAQYAYLVVLRASQQPCTLNELSKMIHTANATVTGVVASLERAGLVRRKENLRDRRSYLVELTARGQRTIDQAYKVHHEHLEAILANVPVADRAVLFATLLRINDGLDAYAVPQK